MILPSPVAAWHPHTRFSIIAKAAPGILPSAQIPPTQAFWTLRLHGFPGAFGFQEAVLFVQMGTLITGAPAAIGRFALERGATWDVGAGF